MSSEAATGKVPVPAGQADEESTFFITDVWALCETVLQRWMPEIGFSETAGRRKKLIQ
jgi:hypothetical protein